MRLRVSSCPANCKAVLRGRSSKRSKSTQMPKNSRPVIRPWPTDSMTKEARYCIWLRKEMSI